LITDRPVTSKMQTCSDSHCCSVNFHTLSGSPGGWYGYGGDVAQEEEEEEEEEEFFNHWKNDLKRHAHTPSGVAGADLKS
jgi:hypothetical protein